MDQDPDDKQLRDAIKAALAAYEAALAAHKPEREIDAHFDIIDELVPHGRFTDIYFYPERDRTIDEMIDEALYREELWKQGGEMAILLHIRKLMMDALEDGTAEYSFLHCAKVGLARTERALEEIQQGTRH